MSIFVFEFFCEYRLIIDRVSIQFCHKVARWKNSRDFIKRLLAYIYVLCTINLLGCCLLDLCRHYICLCHILRISRVVVERIINPTKMLNHVLRPIARNLVRSGTRSSSSKLVDIKPATINDIPQSCGAWKEHYDSRQKVYNTQLIFGITVLVGTITFIKTSGIIFFNFNPPEEPVEDK